MLRRRRHSSSLETLEVSCPQPLGPLAATALGSRATPECASPARLPHQEKTTWCAPQWAAKSGSAACLVRVLWGHEGELGLLSGTLSRGWQYLHRLVPLDLLVAYIHLASTCPVYASHRQAWPGSNLIPASWSAQACLHHLGSCCQPFCIASSLIQTSSCGRALLLCLPGNCSRQLCPVSNRTQMSSFAHAALCRFHGLRHMSNLTVESACAPARLCPPCSKGAEARPMARPAQA
mmetsp:Transcript_35646/g.102519  ORF Transcript_35646/g.102519 Transcript_35646/m.102519 type:complete len:235 (-) Transcript_35646:172-876(-)